MKHIDVEKLKKTIEGKWKELADKNAKVGGGKWDAEIYIYLSILSLIDSLQQEQSKVDYKPLDEDFERDAVSFCLDNGLNTTPYIAKTIAKHFYELGLKAQKGDRL